MALAIGRKDINWRMDPITGKFLTEEITSEPQRVIQIPELPTRRGFYLNEVPYDKGIIEIFRADSIFDMTPANKLIQVNSEPGAGEYFIDKRTSLVIVNPALLYNTKFFCHYFGIGSAKNVQSDSFIQSVVSEYSKPGIGTLIAHFDNIPGAYPVSVMRSRGFALCDGSKAEDQGILDAVITGNLPNLIQDKLFIRYASIAGVIQPDLTSTNGLGLSGNVETFVYDVHGVIDRSPPLSAFGSIPPGYQNFSGDGGGIDDFATGPAAEIQYSQKKVEMRVLLNGGAETRPKNISALPMMRVK